MPGWVAQVGMWGEGGPGTSGGGVSRSCPLQRPDAPTMASDALKLVRTLWHVWCRGPDPLHFK